MNGWKEFFGQSEFSRNLSEGWRLVLDKKKRLNVYRQSTIGNERRWTVTLTPDGKLNPENFVPVTSRLLGDALLVLCDVECQERAVIVGLTETEYLLVSDPADKFWREAATFYDAGGAEEVAQITVGPKIGEGWSVLVPDPDTAKDKAALIVLVGARGAFVLRINRIL